MRFQQVHTTGQGLQLGFKGSFCRAGIPRELGEFHIAAIGGGAGGSSSSSGRGGGRGGTKVKRRNGGRSRERGRRRRRRGIGKALEDGSSGRESIVRASHNALSGRSLVDGHGEEEEKKRRKGIDDEKRKGEMREN